MFKGKSSGDAAHCEGDAAAQPWGCLLFVEMTRCFHRPAHLGGPMEAGRWFYPKFRAGFAPPERSRGAINRPGVMCARVQMHHSPPESKWCQTFG